MTDTPAMDRAREGWGENPPEWIVMLAEACDEGTQSQAASRIKYSPAVVNQLLKNAYPGDLRRLQSAVEGAFGHAVVQCPVLEEISTTQCLSNQRLPLKPTNPQRVRLYQACRRACPYSRISEAKT